MKHTIALMLAAGALALTGCDQVTKIDQDNETGGGGGIPAPVQERLTASCALVGCHVSGSTAPDLSEASGGAWVEASGAGGPYITFGDIENSYLIQKMFPEPASGGQMPFPPGVLAPEDLAVIVGWVAGVEFPSDTGPATTTGEETTGGETTEGETDSGSDPVSCALSEVDPTAQSPVVSGDDASVIPSSIGTALEANCGCHYTDETSDVLVYGGAYVGETKLDTLANFTDDYAGANTNYTGMPAWMAVQDRVITQANMPTIGICETEEGGTMTAADFALFEAWFEQEVPDGASFTPPE